MNQAIDLHDSMMAAVSFTNSAAEVTLSPAYVHRSAGIPGANAGSGWLQPATLTFIGALPVSYPANLPVGVSDGFLRIGDTRHDNVIPACGTFEGLVEFSLVLSTAEELTIRAKRVSIQLHGRASYVEEYKP